MSKLPPYASTGQITWYYSFRIICALIFFFLIAPIIAALSRQVLEDLNNEYADQFRSLSVPRHTA